MKRLENLDTALAFGIVQMQTGGTSETEALGAHLASLLKPGDVVCLHGDLGAGKTTLTRGIVRGLGSPALVSSPTFTLIHEYGGGRLPVYHADAYRLTGENDAQSTGIIEYLERMDGIVIVEWPQRIADILGKERLDIRLSDMGDDENERTVTFTPHGSRWRTFTQDWHQTHGGLSC
jgi:tRNA threonylcarbamoyladenosine biosynthesis protein TsaE